MIVDFLRNIYSEWMEEKLNLETRQHNIEDQICQFESFIQCIKDEEAECDLFSPRKNNHNREMSIQKAEQEKQKLLKELEYNKQMIERLESRMESMKEGMRHGIQQELDYQKLQQECFSQNDTQMKLKILETQENERQRIARDLHDSSIQSLTALIHKIELISKLVDMDPLRCKLELSTMTKTTRKIIEDMRRMIYDLHPMSFDDMGFDVTLDKILNQFENPSLHTEYCIEGEPVTLEPVMALTLLRVIKEACSNTFRHAEATELFVKIIYGKDNLYIIIQDNGKGFQTEAYDGVREDYSGFGLSTMNERVCLLSGKLKIDSKEGQGTIITIEVPLDSQNGKEEL